MTKKQQDRNRHDAPYTDKKEVHVEDNYDYITKFLLEPGLEDRGFSPDKFGHINKNLQVTNLRSTKGEDNQARGYLEAIQILLNYNERYNIQGQTITSNRFTKALNVHFGRLFGLTAVASGTGASLLRTTNTTVQEQKQTLQDETTKPATPNTLNPFR